MGKLHDVGKITDDNQQYTDISLKFLTFETFSSI